MTNPKEVIDVLSDDDILTEIKQEMEDDYEDNLPDTPQLSHDELMASADTRGTLRVMVEKMDTEMLEMLYPGVDWNQKMQEAMVRGVSKQKRNTSRSKKMTRSQQAIPETELHYSSDEDPAISRQRSLNEDAAELIAILEGDAPSFTGLPKRRLVRPSRFSDYVVSKNPAVVHRRVVSSVENEKLKDNKKLDVQKIAKPVLRVVKQPLVEDGNNITFSDGKGTPLKSKSIIQMEKTSSSTPGKRKAEGLNGIVETPAKRLTPMKGDDKTPTEFQFLRRINGFSIVSNFEQLLDQLRSRKLLETHVESMLSKNFSSYQMYELMRNSKPEGDSSKMFTKLQIKFALTIYLYAPKCYRFLKTMFYLPSGKVLSRMMDSTKGNVGFFTEAFHFIKDEMHRTEARDYCIVIDSVPLLPQETVTSSGVVFGSRQLCAEIAGDGPTNEAILVVAVCLNGGLRMPVGFFAVDGEWGGLVARIIDLTVTKMTSRGARVWAVGMDASSRSMRVLRHLGVSFHPSKSPKSCFFLHVPSGSEIHIILDAAHLLQLARFTQFLVKSDEGEVMWPLVSNLLHVAQKICKTSDKDVLLENLYMFHSVSRPISQAIDFMRSTSGRTFALSQATCSFINSLNDLYEVTNSQNIFGPNGLNAVNHQTADTVLESINNMLLYFSTVQLHYNKIAGHNNCSCNYEDKLSFLYGCHLTLNSLSCIIEKLFKKSDLKILFTNMFSLDLIDQISLTINQRRGNGSKLLTLLQYKEGLMDIMYHHMSEYTTFHLPALTIVNFRSAKRSPRRVRHKFDTSTESMGFMLRSSLYSGEYHMDGVLSVCKVLVGELSSELVCSECASMLRKDTPTAGQHDYSLLSWERSLLALEGGAAEPSQSLIKTVSTCERYFRKAIPFSSRSEIISSVVRSVLFEFISLEKFPFYEYEHSVAGGMLESLHESQLVRLICEKYLSLRMSSLHLLLS